jgi:hypothetical protein
VDWRQAAEVAIRLLGQAQSPGGIDQSEYVLNAVHDEGLDDLTQTAIVLLAGFGAGIQLSDPDDPWRYHDGQHRVAAQLDQGVPRTIIQVFP